MSSISFHEISKLSPEGYAALMKRSEADLSSFMEKVQPIIAAVKEEGDAALVRFGQNFDGAKPLTQATLKVSEAEFDAAFKSVDEEVIAAIKYGIGNIRTFHNEQKPKAMWFKEIQPGAFAGDRYTPIQSVALYVPRGKGAFPSVTMMTAVPAVVAGVPNLAIFTPPTPDGSVDAATLVAARIAGVETVYKCGGAQAVAAAAYGTQTIKPALKIVGPGSPWVVAAKRQLSSIIDPGLPAGPSEAIIFADESVHGGLAALDLLIESEHGPDSSAYLVTHSRRVAEEALAALPEHWAQMGDQRVEFSKAVLSGSTGGIILTSSLEESYKFINDYAPEHLELLSTEPFEHLGHITEAAEILMGPHTPVSIGNFALGPNAVLPTSQGARTYGPLSVHDFVKCSSIGYVTKPAYPEMARNAHILATYEGFDAHANAVSNMRAKYPERNKMTSAQPSRTAVIRKLAMTDVGQAISELTSFLRDVFNIEINGLRINQDQYSLNSLNGFFQSSGSDFFFKFHQEEGEEDMKGEYYRAEVIADAGLPIDMPVMTSTLPGEQILVYKKREDKRFSDVLSSLDKVPDDESERLAVNAEEVLNQQILDVALRTLHPVSPEQVSEEPIHHLFFDRMIDLDTKRSPGGRYKQFYVGQNFEFPGVNLNWEEFSKASIVINNQRMVSTFGQIFDAATHYLDPVNLADAGGFTAHGDAHNANVWFETDAAQPKLSYFDPAFAGEHIPSLLAEAKATFHNVFAHPLWLYDSKDAEAEFQVVTKYEDGTLFIDSNWASSRIRERLLSAKIECFWRPFLKELALRGMLPSSWQQTLRSALAMCPALVMNLRSGVDRHNPTSSAIAFSIIAICGSEPTSGSNQITEFLRRIDPLRT